MPMRRWKPLAEYHPLARELVQYMWNERPPLLPAGFAERMRVPRQMVAKILNDGYVPEVPLLVRFAREMGRPVNDLFVAAGLTTPDDPLFDRAGAWDDVRAALQAAPDLDDATRALVLRVLVEAQPPTTIDRPNQAATTSITTAPASAISQAFLPEPRRPSPAAQLAGLAARAQAGNAADSPHSTPVAALQTDDEVQMRRAAAPDEVQP